MRRGGLDLIRLSQRALFDSIELSLLLPKKTAFALRVYWTDIEWNEIFFCLSFVRTSRRWLQSGLSPQTPTLKPSCRRTDLFLKKGVVDTLWANAVFFGRSRLNSIESKSAL